MFFAVIIHLTVQGYCCVRNPDGKMTDTCVCPPNIRLYIRLLNIVNDIECQVDLIFVLGK